MGYTIWYRTTEQVEGTQEVAILDELDEYAAGRFWLNSEPVSLDEEDGYLIGFSKITHGFHPDEEAEADASGLPEGGIPEVLEFLRRASERHGLVWRVGDDHQEVVGEIRNGKLDAGVRQLMEQARALRAFAANPSAAQPEIARSEPEVTPHDDDDDDFEPIIIKFPRPE